MAQHALHSLEAGMLIPFGGDRCTSVSAELAAAFQPGDSLHVVQDSGALLHIPAHVSTAVREQMDIAAEAFLALQQISPEQVAGFYTAFAQALADDAVWDEIEAANAADITRAQELGRSTTRLRTSDRMRADMIAGLQGWADRLLADSSAFQRRVDIVDHGTWTAEVTTAPLGVIGFVFEGRPNVFADAAGVLATGNTAVLRIGGDALSTAQAIARLALEPALQSSGLPAGAVSLIPVRDRSAGWALFSDSRLALAVARGSGGAVSQLGSVARQSGVPLSAHGTGGAWMFAAPDADSDRLQGAVRSSLDRKVCNTLNVAVVVRERAEELVPLILHAADSAAGGQARIHVVEGSEQWLPAEDFTRTIPVVRAEGTVQEPRATVLSADELGTEWEWEGTPEFSIVVVDALDDGIALFNEHSPQFVASLISPDAERFARFSALVNAPFVGDGFTRWVDGQYALNQPELGLSNWENGRLLARSGVLSGADLTTRRIFAHHAHSDQHR